MNSNSSLRNALAALLLAVPAIAHCSLALWSAPSMERISRTSPPRSADVISLAAARNAWESVQVIVNATSAEQAQASFVITPFTSADGSILPPAQLYQEGYVKVTTASPHSPLGTGEYADALIPASDATPTKEYFPGTFNQPWWLDQFIPADAAPGLYSATVTCQTNDSKRTLEVELTVWPVTLPDRSTLRSSFGANWCRVAEIHNLPAYATSSVLRSKVREYQTVLAAHRLTPEPMYPEIEVAADGTIKSFPIEELRPYFENLHATSFALPICASWPFADPLGKHRAATIKYLSNVIQAMHKRGWGRGCFVDCPVDEPASAKAYDQVRAWGAICHAAAEKSGLAVPLLCTISPTLHDEWGSLIHSVDIWTPSVGDILLDSQAPTSMIKSRQAEGEIVWAYTAMVNYPDSFVAQHPDNPIDQHPPAWLIDYAPMNYRIMAWQCAANNWQGLLYWDTIHWGDDSDPWQNPATFTEPGRVYNGDGCLMYPSSKGPLASIRLKWLRQGMEDHCLLELARQAGLTDLVNHEVKSIAPSIAGWSADPKSLLEARLRIGNALAASISNQTAKQ
jgi:hypothetical protein